MLEYYFQTADGRLVGRVAESEEEARTLVDGEVVCVKTKPFEPRAYRYPSHDAWYRMVVKPYWH